VLTRAAILLFCLTGVAVAQPVQQFVPQASVAAAWARSRAMCGAAKAADGVHPACDLVQLPTSAPTASGSVLTFAAVPLEGVDPHVYVGEPAHGTGLPANARVAAFTATTITLGDYGPGGNVVPGRVSVAAPIPAGTVITFGRTTYHRSVQALTDGTAAVVLLPSDNMPGLGLTAAEQTSAKAESDLGTKLPWIVTQAVFQARLTAVQVSELNATTIPSLAAAWTAIKVGATVSLHDPGMRAFVATAAAAGILSKTDIPVVLEQMPVAIGVPPP
jgi:hypothetical protein